MSDQSPDVIAATQSIVDWINDDTTPEDWTPPNPAAEFRFFSVKQLRNLGTDMAISAMPAALEEQDEGTRRGPFETTGVAVFIAQRVEADNTDAVKGLIRRVLEVRARLLAQSDVDSAPVGGATGELYDADFLLVHNVFVSRIDPDIDFNA